MLFLFSSCLAIYLLVFAPAAAKADSGLPMLIVVWPASWVLMLVIIPFEAFIAAKVMQFSTRRSLTLSLAANAVSTIVGIPLTWGILVFADMAIMLPLSTVSQAFGWDNPPDMAQPLKIGLMVLSTVLSSPWVAPPFQEYGDINWQLPVMMISLCIPFWLISIWSENYIARRFIADKSKAWRWSTIANSVSYGLIVMALIGMLGYVIWSHKQEGFGYLDRAGKLIAVPPNTYKLKEFSEGLAPILIGKKWGYVDKSGKCVIAPQFESAAAFSNGLAQVLLAGRKEHDFIDKSGRLVIKLGLPETEAFSEVAKPFSQGLAVMQSKDEKYGFINTSGNVVIKCQFANADSFSEGLAAVENDQEKWGYVNCEGKIIIEPRYVSANEFSERLAVVQKDRDHWACVNKQGQEVFQLPVESTCWGGLFSEGLLAFSLAGKEGYLNREGKIVIQPGFSAADKFAEGLACVDAGTLITRRDGDAVSVVSETHKYGYIDKSGNFVITPKYEYAESFSQGRAAVKVSGRWGFIDKQGHFVVPPKFSQVGNFSDGLAAVGQRWLIELH